MTPPSNVPGSSRKRKQLKLEPEDDANNGKRAEHNPPKSESDDSEGEKAVLPLNLQPRRSEVDLGLPWAHEWPEIIQHYIGNPSALEFTGSKLYKGTGRQTPMNEYVRSFRSSPATLTILMLFAETARSMRGESPVRLLWLKGEAIKLVNESLRDERRQLSGATLSDVVRLANYEHIFGSIAAMRAHRAGVKQMIEAMGGIRNVQGDAKVMVPIILWADRARQATRVYDPEEPPLEYPHDFEPGLQPLHPLNTALLPPERLKTRAERTHAIGTSILGPGTGLMVALHSLQSICSVAAMTPPTSSLGANTVRAKLSNIEEALLSMSPDDSGFFTDEKYILQRMIFETARLSGLVVVNRIMTLLDRTKSTCAKFDHAMMSEGMLDITPLMGQYTTVLVWATFLQGPFLEGPLRLKYIRLAHQACERLEIESWEGLKSLLKSFYYYTEIQEGPAGDFWEEVRPQIRRDLPYREKRTYHIPELNN